MNEHDDLFEFEDFDDNDLELDLDELFGDLETLVIDPDDASLLEPTTAPVQASAPQPSPQPVPEASAPAQPSIQPVAQPLVQPVAQQVAALAQDPSLLQPAQPTPRAGGRPTRTTLALGAAAVVTLANLAAMAIPRLADPDQPAEPTPVTTTPITEPLTVDEPESTNDAERALLARIDQLEAQVRGLGSPTEGVTPNRSDQHRVIDEARALMTRGDHVGARKRLYSLLAIIDRLPTYERDRNEALASYLLADTYKLEAERGLQEAGL